MAKAIMIQGTASSAGKTLLATGLCRIFRQDGLKVAPFKAQNMALNSFITREGHEMGRAQVMQAEACGLAPDIRMNPVLLKPTSDSGSQVIVHGEAVGDMNAREYYAMKGSLRPVISQAYASLAAENDLIVIEGAGSPAEINLREDDLVNMGMAAMAQSPVLLAGDIDRGGVFAALAGTMLLLTSEERAFVKGVIINKFRGDVSILRPGLTMLEAMTGVPVLGVVPWLDVQVDDEDSLTARFVGHTPQAGNSVDIAVVRLPRIANFTDFNALEYMDSVGLRYVRHRHELGKPDCIILPGSKNTLGDLDWLYQSGLAAAIVRHAAKDRPVLGICGGLQMLGQDISDPHGAEGGGAMAGLGLLPFSTKFSKKKERLQTEGHLAAVDGIFAGLSGLAYKGYEIHMGQSDFSGNIINTGNVYGTYLHGLFDSEAISLALVAALFRAKGLDPARVRAFDMEGFKQEQYDLLASALRKAINMDAVYRIVEEGV